MEKTVKCRWGKRCLHKGELIPISKAIEEGKGCYYHPDCLRAKKNCQEIIDLFATELNPNVVFNQLNHVINTLVFEREVDSGMLLYGIRWCVDHGWNIRYPQGLYRVMQEQEWQDEYKKKAAASVPKVAVEIKDDFSEEGNFEYVATKQKSFGDILR